MTVDQIETMAGAAASLACGILLLAHPETLQLEHWSKDKRTAFAVVAFVATIILVISTAF